jgi:hypothetical protein
MQLLQSLACVASSRLYYLRRPILVFMFSNFSLSRLVQIRFLHTVNTRAALAADLVYHCRHSALNSKSQTSWLYYYCLALTVRLAR